MVNLSRGDIAWADLPVANPIGSEPAGRRPVLVVQANAFTNTRIATVIVAVITSNTRLSHMPGNVLVTKGTGGLTRDSVVNISQLITIDKKTIDRPIGSLPQHVMDAVDTGLRKVLSL